VRCKQEFRLYPSAENRAGSNTLVKCSNDPKHLPRRAPPIKISLPCGGMRTRGFQYSHEHNGNLANCLLQTMVSQFLVATE
jgi:hypothetical protein